MEIDLNNPGTPPAADLIQDGDVSNFAALVVNTSMEVPVIVDFWADWCGPCKQLTPVLEKLITQAGGAVKLVKINADENQALAQQLRVQSLPTIMAFKNGQPVDGFMGALPESQVKAFIEKLVGDIGQSPAEQVIEQAEAAMEAEDDLVTSELARFRGEGPRCDALARPLLRQHRRHPRPQGDSGQHAYANSPTHTDKYTDTNSDTNSKYTGNHRDFLGDRQPSHCRAWCHIEKEHEAQPE